MIVDQRGNLKVLASSSEETHLLELFELQNNEGPCLEAFVSGRMVHAQLDDSHARWPSFASQAEAQGILIAYALPMQLRDRTIGALNLFCDDSAGMAEDDVQVARVLSAMTTLGIVNHWTLQQQELLAEQLQTALSTRIVIEQAKGVVAERTGVAMAEAFEVLRRMARSSRRPLSDVAADVAVGRMLPEPGPRSAEEPGGRAG
jgi:ANTAR domain-containing protein